MSTLHVPSTLSFSFFFFNDTATTEIYTLSLHDALPICAGSVDLLAACAGSIYSLAFGSQLIQTGKYRRVLCIGAETLSRIIEDRKSTRLNSSHLVISYAVFCLKKKK